MNRRDRRVVRVIRSLPDPMLLADGGSSGPLTSAPQSQRPWSSSAPPVAFVRVFSAPTRSWVSGFLRGPTASASSSPGHPGGRATVVARAQALATAFGPRFEPTGPV